jgi:adenine phosphoribosyltransferase
MSAEVGTSLKSRIRSIPDFPVPGINFRDITPLLADAEAFSESIGLLCDPWRGQPIDLVASMEARGFIFGAAVARELGVGFIPIRKEGKLPFRTMSARYTLEYRSDVLYVHEDAIVPGQTVLLVDDLIASGGTSQAAVELILALGGKVAGLSFLIELSALGGRKLLEGHQVNSVIVYEED